MKQTLCLIALIILLTSCASSNEKTDEEKAFLHLKLGSSLLVSGKYPEALKELLLAEKYDSNNYMIHNNLGLAYFVREKFQLAETHFRKSILLKKDHTEARNNLGKALIQLGLYSEAVKELKIATEDLTFKEPAKSWSNLGAAYFYGEKYQQATDCFRRSLTIQPNHCRSMIYFGRSLFELEQFEQSSLALDQATNICKGPDLTEAKYYSGISYFRNNQRPQAEARLQDLVATENKNNVYFIKAQKLLDLIKK